MRLTVCFGGMLPGRLTASFRAVSNVLRMAGIGVLAASACRILFTMRPLPPFQLQSKSGPGPRRRRNASPGKRGWPDRGTKGPSVRRHREGIPAAVALLRRQKGRYFVSWRRPPILTCRDGSCHRLADADMPVEASSAGHQALRENGIPVAACLGEVGKLQGPAIWCGRGAKRQERPQSTSEKSRFVPGGSFRGWQRRRNQRPILQTFHHKDGRCLPGSPKPAAEARTMNDRSGACGLLTQIKARRAIDNLGLSRSRPAADDKHSSRDRPHDGSPSQQALLALTRLRMCVRIATALRERSAAATFNRGAAEGRPLR
jgi:hypothetical protein